MVFRTMLAFVFAFTSCFSLAGTTPAKPVGSLPITAQQFHQFVVNAFVSEKTKGDWVKQLPDSFSKKDNQKIVADYKRDPRGVTATAKNGEIIIKAANGDTSTLKIIKFGNKEIIIKVNGKEVTLKTTDNYAKMRSKILKELSTDPFAGLSLFPKAHAIDPVSALVVAAVIIAFVAAIGWRQIRSLWRCLNNAFKMVRVDQINGIRPYLRRGGQAAGCFTRAFGSESEKAIDDVLEQMGASEDLPQMSRYEDPEFIIEESQIAVYQNRPPGMPGQPGSPGEDGAAGEDGATARLWNMFAPSAKLFSMNIQKNHVSK